MEYICSNCGSSLSNDAKFCPECGTKIERELKCSNCGALLAENAKFCMECGTKVGEIEKPHVIESANSEVNDEYASSVKYINEVLPFSDVNHKTPNGEVVSESEFSVVYTLSNNPSIVTVILEKVSKYNKRATKHGFPLIDFNQEKNELKGSFRPLLKTPGMNFFKELHLAGRNGDLCGDFLRICKLCESIMEKK